MTNIFELEYIDIDLKYPSKNTIKCKQWDSFVQPFNVYFEGVPLDLTQYTITLNIKKPNGEIDILLGSISSNIMNVAITSEATVAHGNGQMEIVFESLDKKKTTSTIKLQILPSVLDGGNSGSSGESILGQLVELKENIIIAGQVNEDLRQEIENGNMSKKINFEPFTRNSL